MICSYHYHHLPSLSAVQFLALISSSKTLNNDVLKVCNHIMTCLHLRRRMILAPHNFLSFVPLQAVSGSFLPSNYTGSLGRLLQFPLLPFLHTIKISLSNPTFHSIFLIDFNCLLLCDFCFHFP